MTPTGIFGLSLIIIAVFMFLLEVKVSGFGLLGICGVMALIIGLVLLFGLTSASLPLLIAISIPLIGFFAFIFFLTNRARRNRVVTGEAGMVGLEGHAETSLLPEGKVFVRGELWDAWSPVRIERGEPIRVTGVRGLRLEVTAASPDRVLGRPISVAPLDRDGEA